MSENLGYKRYLVTTSNKETVTVTAISRLILNMNDLTQKKRQILMSMIMYQLLYAGRSTYMVDGVRMPK